MRTLLQPGDKVTIRSDIKKNTEYKMMYGSERADVWIEQMGQPGTEVTIKESHNGKYIVEEVLKVFTYTDEMFDPDLMQYLYEEYLNNK